MELSAIKADQVLDARGLSCPMPLLKTKKALKGMGSGAILEILSTDPGSKNDIPGFCRKGGNEFLGSLDDPQGFTKYFVKRG